MDPKIMRDFRRIVKKTFTSVADQAQVESELQTFRNKEGVWADAGDTAELNRQKVTGGSWHEMYSSGAPLLCKLAMRILSQPSSACACERNWSTYEFIHSPRRNKLQPGRAADLVYVFSNQRILDKMKKPGYQQEVVPWRNRWEEEEEEEDVAEDAAEDGAEEGSAAEEVDGGDTDDEVDADDDE
ncbi:hypothetical protein CHLRE_04g217967v5 [Chlamydomonas reinhardtii]|uniref:HAT C-terminal dimerisation domain-containing protein n=1 Tax=Chlamydomonas reinhardtii TaxID=3055 RepID=A8JDJ8_CHLRE|nr:uncharacterized protein CHLRE_04g217967v5 [Chlamydomonas reinhardtii]PNW83869.1 hypothetical protein CHLRE_04g217967v5 [Chlamydomonas reinhardtii]|eukprot:XP_001700489.1 predicted protein [Chlamydomonas reinhardtii]